MENVPLPEFQYELSERDGIRKFHYKPPETVGDLSKVFPFISAMNNCSPKFSGGEAQAQAQAQDKVSSSQIESSEIEQNGSKES